MALRSIRAGALACSAIVLAAAPAALASDEPIEPAAAAAPTTPLQLTKPASGAGDGDTKGSFSALETKKGMLLGWTNYRSSPFEITAFAQPFTADGKSKGKAAKLEAGFLEGMPSSVPLGGDKVGLVWKSTASTLKGAIVDAKKGKVGKPTTVLSSGAASKVHDMAPLGKGKIALLTRRATTPGDEDTILIILNEKLKPSGSPKVLEQDTPGPLGSPTWEQTITPTDKGALALFRDSKSQITGVPVSSKGKAGTPFQINSTTLAPFNFLSSFVAFRIDAKPLDGGGHVVSWMQHDQGSDLNFNLCARIFDKQGEPIGPDFVVNADLVGNQSSPEILPLRKGFAVAWTDSAPLGMFTHVVRYFDEDGAPISGEIVTQYYGLDGGAGALTLAGYDSDHARFANDDYLKVFGTGGALYGDRLPAPTIGSANDETLDGSDTDDVIVAAGGDDDVSSGDGDDTIDGGDGDDVMDGGAGRNLIAPGPGDDEIVAGSGAEVFVIVSGHGTDEIAGFGSDDRIDVSAFHYNQKEAVMEDARQDGADVLITLNGIASAPKPATVVRLKNRTLANFQGVNIIL